MARRTEEAPVPSALTAWMWRWYRVLAVRPDSRTDTVSAAMALPIWVCALSCSTYEVSLGTSTQVQTIEVSVIVVGALKKGAAGGAAAVVIDLLEDQAVSTPWPFLNRIR